jgi:hypothetical protein
VLVIVAPFGRRGAPGRAVRSGNLSTGGPGQGGGPVGSEAPGQACAQQPALACGGGRPHVGAGGVGVGECPSQAALRDRAAPAGGLGGSDAVGCGRIGGLAAVDSNMRGMHQQAVGVAGVGNGMCSTVVPMGLQSRADQAWSVFVGVLRSDTKRADRRASSGWAAIHCSAQTLCAGSSVWERSGVGRRHSTHGAGRRWWRWWRQFRREPGAGTSPIRVGEGHVGRAGPGGHPRGVGAGAARAAAVDGRRLDDQFQGVSCGCASQLASGCSI